MKDKITLVMYSHSTYSDVWPMFFNQSEKLLTNYKKVLFCDDDLGILPEDWGFIKYNDDDNYSERVASCLAKIDTPLVFFHHEDMPLYNTPDYGLLDNYENIVLSENVDFIRLARSTDECHFNYKAHKTLFLASYHSPYFFAVQPSLKQEHKKYAEIIKLRAFFIMIMKKKEVFFIMIQMYTHTSAQLFQLENGISQSIQIN